MTNLKASTRYDFVSRSIGSVPTHAFDWDLEVYFDSRIYPGQCVTQYDFLSRTLFDVAISASEELGHQIARCGANGDHRARLIAISVEEIDSFPNDVRLQREMKYRASWMSRPQSRSLRTFRAVVTISQTHSNSYLSSRLEEDFQSAVAADLSADLIKSANILNPFCLVCSSPRSEHGALARYSGELPKRVSEPDAFGFHESGLCASFGETSFEDPWMKANKDTGFFLHLRAQFSLHSLSRMAGGVEASEVLLETLISFGYQLALIKRGKNSIPLRAHLRQRCMADVYVNNLVQVLKEQGEMVSSPQANVSIYLPLDRSQSLNQAQRNKLRFFVDKDIRYTFGLTLDELRFPRPYMHALLNNLFVDQLKWWEV